LSRRIRSAFARHSFLVSGGEWRGADELGRWLAHVARVTALRDALEQDWGGPPIAAG
jgi:hypothetical protein